MNRQISGMSSFKWLFNKRGKALFHVRASQKWNAGMDNEDQCFYPYQLFLLMSSNFAGLLTTIVAIRKRYFAESAIYFCTMIISMVSIFN